MERAKVVIIEDNEQIRGFVGQYLRIGQHEVVREAATLDAAMNAVEDMAQGRLEADVVLLDANLETGRSAGHDARIIFDRIKENGLAAKILGFSAYEMRQFGIPVDIDCNKDLGFMLDTINNL